MMKPIGETIPNGTTPYPITIRKLMLLTSISLFVALCLSVMKGAVSIPLSSVISAFANFDPSSTQHLMIRDLRLPRALASAFIGAALAVSGAVMQGTTRNPMADSGLMGINAGAGFSIALCFAFLPGLSYGALILFSFAGAALGALFIHGISFTHRGGENPTRLILAGAAVSALLAALSQGIALTFEVGVDVLFWTMGGVSRVTWSQFYLLAPVVSCALIGALLLSPSISLMNMGNEIAKGLGVHTMVIQAFSTVVVLVLAGISVSVVGAVAFVGLIVPHMARFSVGADYRKIIPASATLGALLLVLADLVARTINPPFEVPLGVITSLLGVPFFLYLSRKTRRSAI